MSSCRQIIPAGGLGGSNKSEPGIPFSVTFQPGPTIDTDADGKKVFLRCRKEVRSFFELAGAAEGDTVVIERTGDRHLTVWLEPKSRSRSMETVSQALMESECLAMYARAGTFYRRLRAEQGVPDYGFEVLYGPPIVHTEALLSDTSHLSRG